MKYILIIFLGAFLLADCNNPQTDKPIENTTAQVKDSSGKNNSKKDTTLEKVQRVLADPFRDINNFDIKLGDRFVDSLHALYSKQGKVTFTKDICIGDNCESWKTIVNKQKNTTLYLFKGDGSEYGFSNDQFLLKNDSLIYARNFIVNVDKWPMDGAATEWKIEEVIYRFQPPIITTRIVITKDLDHFDFTLRGVKAKVKNNVEFNKAYQEKSLELEKLLEMKDSESRE